MRAAVVPTRRPDTILDGPSDHTLRHNHLHQIPTTFHTLLRGDVTIIMTSLREDLVGGPDWDIRGFEVDTGEHFAFWYNARSAVGIIIND